MKIITARERRAEKEYRPRTSQYNITDNLNQLPSVMKATADRLTRHIKIIKDAGLNPNRCNCLICDDAIEAARKLQGGFDGR